LKTKNKGEKNMNSVKPCGCTHKSISLIENNRKVIVKYNLIYDAKNLRKE
jgi:hypothetical protein